MAKSLNALISEVDALIDNKLVKKAEPSDGVVKLASQLREMGKETSSLPVEDYSLIEKVAYARAVMDTLINLDLMTKIEAFEKAAKASGMDTEKIASYIEKNASLKFRTVFEMLK